MKNTCYTLVHIRFEGFDPSEDIVMSNSRQELIYYYKKNIKSKKGAPPLAKDDNNHEDYNDEGMDHYYITETKFI
jgi:hypothetical protein